VIRVLFFNYVLCLGVFAQVAWLDGPSEIRIAFDREIVAHRVVTVTAKGKAVPIRAVRLGFELSTLHVHVDPPVSGPFRIEIASLSLSLPVHTNGLHAVWEDKAGQSVWSGWLPALDVDRSEKLLGATAVWNRLERWRKQGGRLVAKDAGKAPLPEGNTELGRKLFYEKGDCTSCHRHGGKGSSIGPRLDAFDLADVSRVRAKLLDPFSSVHPDFLQRQVTFGNGTSTVGVLRAEKNQVVLADHTGSEQRYPHAAVQVVYNMAGTIMPPQVVEHWTEVERESLVAFLCQ